MKLIEARQFIKDWLWSSHKRETSDQPWPHEYIEDAAQMVCDAINHELFRPEPLNGKQNDN